MSLGKRRKKILDGETLFRYYYVEMGNARSYNKLAEWASSKWGKNPEKGKSWTPGAVWQSAWRWALKHLDEAKKIYKDVAFKYFLDIEQTINPDAVWTEEEFENEWAETVSTHAKTCLTDKQYRNFFRKHPEFQGYERF